jgi:hypothetical protein
MTETRVIKFGDQDWKITPFHFVVGPIMREHFDRLAKCWLKNVSEASPENVWEIAPEAFCYVTERKNQLQQHREETKNTWSLSVTSDPLTVNELQPEEVTLACIENGKLVLTNFADLPKLEARLKVFNLGEFWLNYATGGAELSLREGRWC